MNSTESHTTQAPTPAASAPAQAQGQSKNASGPKCFILDGVSLRVHDLVQIGIPGAQIRISDEALEQVRAARQVVDDLIGSGRVAYGINTGFGALARTLVFEHEIENLQKNLIRSHAAGVGEPLTHSRARMLFALRLNTLSKGFSGVSEQTMQQCVRIFNANCIPRIPEKGSVGASGDLAPLAHLTLALMGEGEMWDHDEGKWVTASLVLKKRGLEPIKLKAKEGLAMINGTQFITALGAEAIVRAESLALQADVIAAFTVEALKGSKRAFDERVHELRPHTGQAQVARRLRALLQSPIFHTKIAESHRFCGKVQDAYSLRCVPQVHGVVWETINFVKRILETEMNSVTDNPIVIPGEEPDIISAGNFHGEYPAKGLDYLAIAVHELGAISEKRLERMMNPAYSDLPAFLAINPGINSGFMLPHVTVTALVSENKTLCHPASIDAITTSAGTEDHVSMGAWAARKCLQVVDNVTKILAIETLAAAQAIEFHRPLTSTDPIEAVLKLVRSKSPRVLQDRYIAPDMAALADLVTEGALWDTVEPFVRKYAFAMEPEASWWPNVLSDIKNGMALDEPIKLL